MMKFNTLILPLAASFILSGCVVAAAADLAATTVFTAGKLAVKGTGALIGAAIPDDDDEDEDKKEKKKARKEKEAQKVSQPEYRPQPNATYTYPAQPNAQPRHITIDADGNAYETRAPYQAEQPGYSVEQY
ncbi:NF038104 family lipoprotein [Neisseria sp. CCUG12390]|uniref:NF038104 family lipoprotein n=1 Tax=Neisseria sp. CCUG12390 TaxID=3392035 RepID=UPI003A0FC2D8